MLTILAICCLLFIIGGYHLLYQVRLAEIKADVKKELVRTPKSNLTQLVFSATDFASLDWDGQTEFRYQGTMYDVVTIEKKENKIICFCLPDGKETALVDQYLKTQNSSEKNPSQSLVKLLKAPFLPIAFLKQEAMVRKVCTTFSLSSFSLLQTDSHVLTPPPKFC